MADLTTNTAAEPRGPKLKKAFSRTNIFLYGTLIMVSMYYLLPLYVMIVTSLKGMPEIRLGNVFGPPMDITFEPWVRAWSEACTGINCDGLSRGFGNSVRILIPSVLLSIAIASVNGYALSNWKFKGSEVFFYDLDYWGLHPLSDDALSDCDHVARNGVDGFHLGIGPGTYGFWNADPDVAVSKLLQLHPGRAV